MLYVVDYKSFFAVEGVLHLQIRLMATVRANTRFAPATPLPSIFSLIEQRAAAGPLLKVFFTFNVYLSAR